MPEVPTWAWSVPVIVNSPLQSFVATYRSKRPLPRISARVEHQATWYFFAVAPAGEDFADVPAVILNVEEDVAVLVAEEPPVCQDVVDVDLDACR